MLPSFDSLSVSPASLRGEFSALRQAAPLTAAESVTVEFSSLIPQSLDITGAEKLTRYFGNLLQTEHGLEDHRSDPASVEAWAPRLAQYQGRKEQKQ